ncbi:MAG: hypothetical protein ACR2P0_11035 [Acidimicrobiales bacterium]
MLLLAGAVGTAMLLLVGALILIAQAGASDEASAPTTIPEVIFAAETPAEVEERRISASALAPGIAFERLDALDPETVVPSDVLFATGDWMPRPDGCISVDERVFIARSAIDVTYADDLDCVVDRGRWIDRYQDRRLVRAVDAEVVLHVPTVEVHRAGGWRWDARTRDAYVADLAHPASLQVISTDSGHNPRGLDPAGWKPADEGLWCAYAVDWIAVKARWGLGADPDERLALEEMLETCPLPTSLGADPITVPLDEPVRPTIGVTAGS